MCKDDLLSMIETITTISQSAETIFSETDGTTIKNDELINVACSLKTECCIILNSLNRICKVYNQLQNTTKTW